MTSTLIPDEETTEAPSESSRVNLPRPALLALAGVVAVAVIGGGAYEFTKGSSSPAPTTAATTAAAPATGGGAAAAKAPAVPAATTLSQAMTNAEAQRSVRITSRAVTLKHETITQRIDSGRIHGIQQVHFKGGSATIRLAHGDAYLFGNETGLSKLGLPASEASLFAGHWISLTPGQRGYRQVSSGITLSSALSQIRFKGALHALPARVIGGKHVVGVTALVPVSHSTGRTHVTLWVTQGANSLPVEYTATYRGATFVVHFSSWGERFHVKTPDAI